MHAPYVERPEEAFQLAELGLGAVLTLVGGLRPLRSRLALAPWLVAVWIAAAAPIWVTAWGPTPGPLGWWLTVCRCLLLLAIVANRNLRAGLWALPAVALAAVGAWWLRDSDLELAAFHLHAVAWVYGTLSAAPSRLSSTQPAPRQLAWPTGGTWRTSALWIVAGTIVAASVSSVVLDRKTDSSDEWSYTYQAYLFAKLRAYGSMFTCGDALRPFWVIHKDGRVFSQYQPGWPVFMVPFVWMRCVWLAGPLSFGLFVEGMRRLGRTIAHALPNTTESEAARAGWVAGGVALFSSMLLVNGGSRYPHVFVLALFAFALQQTIGVVFDAATPRVQAGRAAAIGTAFGWILCTRVPDGALMGLGPALLLLAMAARRKIPVRVIGIALGAFLPWVLFLFWISKLQVGHWGQLAYQYGSQFYPWNQYRIEPPQPNELKWHVSTMWGAYCYWPISPALGLAGLALALRESRRALWVIGTLAISALATNAFYASLDVGRGNDFGYGPRYQFIVVIPAAVGMALLVQRLARRASPRIVWWSVGGVLAGFTVLTSAHVFGSATRLVANVGKIERAVERAHLRNAVVIIQRGTHTYGEQDLHNVPVELYWPNVVFANDSNVQCVREGFPNRAFYKASPSGKGVEVTPLP